MLCVQKGRTEFVHGCRSSPADGMGKHTRASSFLTNAHTLDTHAHTRMHTHSHMHACMDVRFLVAVMERGRADASHAISCGCVPQGPACICGARASCFVQSARHSGAAENQVGISTPCRSHAFSWWTDGCAVQMLRAQQTRAGKRNGVWLDRMLLWFVHEFVCCACMIACLRTAFDCQV